MSGFGIVMKSLEYFTSSCLSCLRTQGRRTLKTFILRVPHHAVIARSVLLDVSVFSFFVHNIPLIYHLMIPFA